MFQKRLIQCRKTKGWTQAELARLLNMKRSTYAKYETGENEPNITTLIRLANLFNVSTDYLIGVTSIIDENDFGKIDYLMKIQSKLDEIDIDIKDFFEMNYLFYLNAHELTEIKNHIEWVVNKAINRSNNKK